jgi:dolichol-phosphate mannosyltransferase
VPAGCINNVNEVTIPTLLQHGASNSSETWYERVHPLIPALVDERACTVVIPAYNEEGRILPLLADLEPFQWTVIVVFDGTDRTAELVGTFAADHPGMALTCLRFDHRLGKGGGVLAGIRAAETPYVGFLDADGSTAPDQMALLFDQLARVDGAIGSRWVLGSVLSVAQGPLRRFQSRVFNLLIRLLFHLNYQDTQCGAKVFRRSVLAGVLPQMVSTGFEFDVELLWRLSRGGFQVIEVPIVWADHGGSKVGGSDALHMAESLVRLRFLSGRTI